MKSKVKHSKNRTTFRFGGYVIDFICLVFVGGVITIEVLKRRGFEPLLKLIENINFRISLNSTAELVLVLLPTIITVVSIVLSLMKEKI